MSFQHLIPAGFSVRGEERSAAASLMARLREAAREDPAAFARYALRHEITGRPIELAPMHWRWHDLMSQYRKLIIWSHVEGGKTNQAIARLTWEIGRNPNKRYAVVGISQGAASKIVSAVSQYIQAPQVREVFPDLKPGRKWTTAAITVKRTAISKDPTLQALGANKGHPIGARLDGVLLDDVLDHLNTGTREQRAEMVKWYLSEIVGRLTEDAWVWVVGNAYYSDDLLHELAAKYGFRWAKFPVADADGRPAFPDNWSPARIAQVEDDLGGKGSPEAQRQLYCVPRSDQTSRVQEAWIQACLRRGLDMPICAGLSPEEIAALASKDEDGKVITAATAHTGVDIGIGKKKRSAKTVRFSILRMPNGDIRVLDVASGRWSAREIVSGVLADQARFAAVVAVESNGAQKFLLDNAHDEDEGSQLFVVPHNTGANKHHPVLGVESVFADLARQRFIIPAIRQGRRIVGATPAIREWIQEMLDYNPEGHTGDHLMAAWIARENARAAHMGSQIPGVGVKILGGRPEPALPEYDDEGGGEDDNERRAWSGVA